MAKHASEGSARRQRGELDPEGEERRARLHEVIARQQQLGLLKEAGTADLLRAASGRGAGFGGSFRGGRGGRSGRQGGRGGLPDALVRQLTSALIQLKWSTISASRTHRCSSALSGQLCYCLRQLTGSRHLSQGQAEGRALLEHHMRWAKSAQGTSLAAMVMRASNPSTISQHCHRTQWQKAAP